MIARLGLNTAAPFHFLFYSIVFGGSVFHSFIVSPIAFKHLSRPEFSNLQNKVFPTYFLGQALSPLVLGLTTPLKLCPFTIGLLALSSATGALNYFVLLPWCQQIKDQRNKLVSEKLHEVIENGEVKPSEEMVKLNKQFGKYHGISSLVNILSILSLSAYGVILSKRLL